MDRRTVEYLPERVTRSSEKHYLWHVRVLETDLRRPKPAMVTLWTVIGLTLLTPLIQILGPRNRLRLTDSLLITEDQFFFGLVETVDSVILLLYLIAGVAIFQIEYLADAGTKNEYSRKLGSRTEVAFRQVIVFYLATILVPLASGPQVNVESVSIVIVFFSWAFLLNSVQPINDKFRSLEVIAGIGGATFLVMQLYQNSRHIFDPYHTRFVANELASVSAGNFPLSTFVSQYSNALPYLVAPVIRLSPLQTLDTVLLALLAMKLSVLAIAFYIIIRSTKFMSTRYFGLLLVMGYGILSKSYTPIFPTRQFLPIVSIYVFWSAIKQTHYGALRFWHLALAGSLSAVLILNNPDFGTPAAVALVLTSMRMATLRGSGLRRTLVGIGSGLIATLCVVSLVFIALLDGFRPQDAFLFARVFGGQGFLREPVALLEPNLVLIPVFLVGISIGSRIVLDQKRQDSVQRVVCSPVGFWLLIVSLYGLFIIVYPMGRSFSSNFDPLLLPASLVSILIIDHLRMTIRVNLWTGNSRKLSVGSAFLFVGILGASFSAGRCFPNLINPIQDYHWTTTSEVDRYLSILGTSSDQLMESRGKTDFVLGWSNLLEVELGLNALMISNDPASIALSRDLADRQCARFSEINSPVIVEKSLYDVIGRLESCRRLNLKLDTEFLSPALVRIVP